MSVIYGGVLAAFVLLLVLSGREPIEGDWKPDTMYRIFLKPAVWLKKRRLPKWIRKAGAGRMAPGGAAGVRLMEDMRLLYPSDAEKRLYRYSAEKISALLLLCAAGCILALLIRFSAGQSGRLTQDGWVRRNPYGGGSVQLELEADTGEEKERLQIEVEEQKYTRKQLEEMIPRVREILEEELKGENQSLDEVYADLYLPDRVEGYPFRILWESGNYGLVRSDGTVMSEEAEAGGELVELSAVLSYFETKWEERFWVRICPAQLTGREAFRKDLEDAVEKQAQEAEYEESFRLPDQTREVVITWRERIEDNSPLVFLIFVLAGFAQYAMPDRELKKKLEERERDLLLSYPEFISKLVLLLGAGLPIRAAFTRMAADYRKKQKQGGFSHVYEEILVTCHEMENGVTESTAYEHFGLRCRLPQYRKCTSLLVSNLQMGSAGLLHVLREEAGQAFQERKHNARQEGERAGTKLLFPMMLLLVMIMVLIMVPACFSFAGM